MWSRINAVLGDAVKDFHWGAELVVTCRGQDRVETAHSTQAGLLLALGLASQMRCPIGYFSSTRRGRVSASTAVASWLVNEPM